MEKEGNIEDCLKVHERIHVYLNHHDELLFRNDYVTNYVYILTEHNRLDQLEKVLLTEIWFLKNHLEESNARKSEMYTWKVALGLVYMMKDNPKSVALLVNENKVRKVDSGRPKNEVISRY